MISRRDARASPVGWELLVGTAAALVALLSGGIGLADVRTEIDELLPVIAFLVAITVLAQACAAEGLFVAIGTRVARAGGGSATVMLALTFVVAATTTTVLSLDATAVLLTPVLMAASRQLGQSVRPGAYAAVRLSNSASTLLPISNLTNLLAFGATGLSFLGFAWAMLPVWLVAITLEFGVLRVWFARDLRGADARPVDRLPIPRVALAVVVAVLAGFALGSPMDLQPAWSAAAGAAVLTAHAWRRGFLTPRQVAVAANLPFAYFVVCWAIAVAALGATPVGDLLRDLLPDGTGVGGIVTIALVAMLTANAVNNLPATLLLLPLLTPLGPAAVLAMLVGVNVGANLTYVGSLANILWRRSIRMHGETPSAREFHLLGLVTTPLIVVVCALTLAGWTTLIW